MKLTQKEKRIKVAESCGLSPIESDEFGLVDQCGVELPDYFNDLNDARKSERWLADNTALSSAYWRKVVELVCVEADEPLNFDECTMFMAITAHAEIRAEAFGLVMELWTPND